MILPSPNHLYSSGEAAELIGERNGIYDLGAVGGRYIRNRYRGLPKMDTARAPKEARFIFRIAGHEIYC